MSSRSEAVVIRMDNLRVIHGLKMANGSTKMNPATLLRMKRAFPAGRRSRPVHILRIGAEAGTWPQTVYRAEQMGYLHKTAPGTFKPTDLFWEEVRA